MSEIGWLDKKFVKHPVCFSLFFEVIVALPLILVCGWFNPSVAKSVLLGIAVFVVPNAYFTLYAFRYRSSDLTPWIVRSFKWGQTGKLALTMVGFALVFKLGTGLIYEAIFGGFIAMVLVHWGVAAY